MSVTRIRVLDLEEDGHPLLGVVTIDRKTLIMTVRPHRKRTVYQYPLANVCRAIISSGIPVKVGELTEQEDSDEHEHGTNPIRPHPEVE